MNVIFEVKDELGKMHHVPADLLALKDAFFDELFLIRMIIENHCKKMDIIDIAQQRTPPIFPIDYIKPDVLRTLLNWGYTGQLDITDENAIDLLLAFDYNLAFNMMILYADFVVFNVLGIENAWTHHFASNSLSFRREIRMRPPN